MKHRFIMSSSSPPSNSELETSPNTDLTVPSQSFPPPPSELIPPSASSQDSKNFKKLTPNNSVSGSESKSKTTSPRVRESLKRSSSPSRNNLNPNLNLNLSPPQQSEKRPHSSRPHRAPQDSNAGSNSDLHSNSSLPPPPTKTFKSKRHPYRSPGPTNSKSNSYSNLYLVANSNYNTYPNAKGPASPPSKHRSPMPPAPIYLPRLAQGQNPNIESLTPKLQASLDITTSLLDKPVTTLPVTNDLSRTKKMSQPPYSSSHDYSYDRDVQENDTPRNTNFPKLVGIVLFVFLGAMALFLYIKKSKKECSRYRSAVSSSVGAVAYKSSRNYVGAPPIDPLYRRAVTSSSSQTHSSSQQNPNGSSRAGCSPATPSNNTSSRANFSSSFSYEEITDMTGNFSRENLIGEGGFGWVYKGWMPDGGCVAVKQLKVGSGQGEREFRAEVENIGRIHHQHLVSLVGYCVVDHHRMLVYEFVPNNTLDYHLHGKGVPAIDWENRVKIAIGASRGLTYLHEDCHPRIIHRDIKSANILLDYAFEAQVTDFGLAKLETFTHVSTRISGTFGYLAPEYASTGKLTDKSDVFSFGVVLLELITGRKPVDTTQPPGEQSLVEWARPLLVNALETGQIHELVDPKLENNYDLIGMTRMIEVAAACVRNAAMKRPRMVQVNWALDREGRNTDSGNGWKLEQSMISDGNQYQSSEAQKFQQLVCANDGSTGSSTHRSSGTPNFRSNSYRY